MKFRNYVPQDKELQEGKLAPPVLPKFEDPVAAAPPPSEKEACHLITRMIYIFACLISPNNFPVLKFLFFIFFIVILGSISEHCSKETELGSS